MQKPRALWQSLIVATWRREPSDRAIQPIFDYLCNRAVFLFFFSRPFHEIFKFLKNCPYDFHEILHSHSTPYYGHICAMASKSYGWGVRNIAKMADGNNV